MSSTTKNPHIYLDNQVVKVRDLAFRRKASGKRKRSNFYYLDNAASTPISKEVQEEVLRAIKLDGNPSSFNDAGRLAREEMDKSRIRIARFIGAKPEEIVFTASGSEANNLAILGLANSYSRPAEIITTPIEHPSVLGPMEELKKKGWKITYLKVNSEGFVDLEDLKNKLNPKVVLVSIIYANNEIGTVQPINKISKIITKFKIENLKLKIHETTGTLFHADSCQATGYLNMNVNSLGVDLMTFNGSKIGGPRGIAALYKKKGVTLRPLVLGGGQEHGLRAGTENLPAIAGFAKAVSLIDKKEGPRSLASRDYFFENIQKIMPDIKINGSIRDRLPNNINISIPGVTGEQILLELDKKGIYASSGSACTAHSVEPSHVLKAIGVSEEYINGALRLSLGKKTTKKDIDYVLEVLPKAVTDLRKRYRK